MAFDITSANATVVLSVEKLFPAGIQLQQFSADTAFSPDGVTVAEARMGVDGKLVAGQTPTIKQVTVQLEACSPSARSLTTLLKAMESMRKPYECTMVITIPSIGKKATYRTGVLVQGTPVPAGQRVLSPTQWTFNFESVEISGD